MTDPDAPGTPTSRRHLLRTLTAGGSMALAGCGMLGGTNTSTDTGGETPTTSGQTLRIPIQENDPAKTTFYQKAPESALSTTVKEQATGKVQSLVWEPGIWPDGLWALGDFHYNWVDEVDITPTEVTITIGDDAKWSDGHQITGRDIAVGVLVAQINKHFPPFYASEEQDANLILGAFDDFELTEQTVTYRSTPGYFENYWKWSIGLWLVGGGVPTHIEPYKSWSKAALEAVRQAQQGKSHPWDNKVWHENPDTSRQILERKYLDKRKYVYEFSKPENVLATGAWDLVEIRGSEAFVFEKNEHHRNADNINFERAVLEYTPTNERERAALKADRLDYGSGLTPQTVVKSFPPHITEQLVPGSFGSGNGLGLNFNHPALGKRAVRKALMYVLDRETIAANIHPSTAVPVDTPGGDCWDTTEYVSQDWVDENLATYEPSRERAASLMQEAGYTKEGQHWVDADGERLSLTLATDSTSPRWEPTVASQLSQFGIQTSVQTLDGNVFSSRVNKGEFPLWATGGTSTGAATLGVWLNAPQHPEKHGIYPEKQFETGRFGRGGTPLPWSEDRWDVFTIKAPPIGQPDGSLQEYHPSALALGCLATYKPSEAEFRRRVKVGMWLANWFLPSLPINKTLSQHFIDDTHWVWPKDTPSWRSFSEGTGRNIVGMAASGDVRANPDNPEEPTPDGDT